jgi:hypothetical protein
LVTVALNQEFTDCELKRASQSGGVRLFAEAVARFAPEYSAQSVPADPAKPSRAGCVKPTPAGCVKQSYTRLSDRLQGAIYGPLAIAIPVRQSSKVLFSTCRPLRQKAAVGLSAFLVSSFVTS